MRELYRYDDNGIYVEPVILTDDSAENPPNTTDVRPEDGMFQAKWDGLKWLENLLPDEIQRRLADKGTPDDIESLQKQMADLSFQLMMNGVI